MENYPHLSRKEEIFCGIMSLALLTLMMPAVVCLGRLWPKEKIIFWEEIKFFWQEIKIIWRDYIKEVKNEKR